MEETIPKETCPICNGKGAILHNDIEIMDYNCPKCKGTGKVDWVEMAMKGECQWEQ